MKNFAHQWQRKSCFFLLLLAVSKSGISMPLPTPKIAIVKPIAWTITGKVVTNTGEPVPGVTVLQKGTSNGTATGVDGSYSINVPETPGTLVFSFIGYTTQEVAFTKAGAFNVTLTEDAKALDEVVVVGYGTQKKSDLTGSVTSVTAKDFNQGSITSPEQLITGKVPGVQITSNSGAPGAGSRIRIRGGASLTASNDPLIVIDGVPLDNAELKGSANALNMINPNDIESFNVLKDASATAIYGSRASNGVIIITTKKGSQDGKMKVSFSSLLSFSKIRNTVDVLSADQFRAAVQEQVNTGVAPATQPALFGLANTNWQDQIFQDAFTHDDNISLSGAIQKVPYRISVGYLDQEGVLKTSELKRSSAALSLNPSFLKDHLKVNLNLKGAYTKSRFADQGVIGGAVVFDPTQPIYADNQFGGYFEWVDSNGKPNTLASRNPLSILEQKNDRGEVKRSIGNLQLDYKFHFLPELRANLNVGYDISQSEGNTFQPATLAGVFNQGGTSVDYSQERTNKLLDFYLNYTKELPLISSRIDVTGGYSYQDFLRDAPAYATFTEAGSELFPAGLPVKSQNTLVSFFGRLNYSLLDRYLLTATIRRDGSSRFNPDNRWGTFPSVALAWRLIEESFLQGSNVFSDLKLRVGYGITGQQDIGNDYPYLPRYTYSDNSAMYQFGNTYYNTLRPEGYDRNIKWEETTTYNAGLDFGFAKNRLTGSVDVYQKKTKDLLAQIDIPAGSNLTNRIYTNVGTLENKGIEAALNYNIINNDRFNWSAGINGTLNHAEITNLSKVKDQAAEGIPVGTIAGGVGNNIQIHTVGYAPYSFYVYKQVYDETGKPVEGLYEDLNEDGVINQNDKYRYKNPAPKVILGFNSNVSYDKWSLSFVLRGNLGNYMYNNVYSNTGTYKNITFPNYLTNMSTNVLETNFTGNDPNRLFSDYYIQNASFLRLDNLNLGYNFGKIAHEKINLRLSASAQNLFVITNYKGLDPETQFNDNNIGGGIDNNFYPRPRIFSLGVNVDF